MKIVYHVVSAASLAVLLSACAGGGGTPMPTSPGVVGNMQPANPADITRLPAAQQPSTHHSNPAVGKLIAGQVPVMLFGSLFQQGKFIYETADGKLYPLTGLSDPFIPASSGASTTLTPNVITPRVTENGDKFVVCCDSHGSSFAPGYLGDADGSWGNLRYGVWITPSGDVDLFYGGREAEVARMQGAAANGGVPTGKATYEVFAFRAANGQITASTHDTARNSSQRSFLTVNFNTSKVGGSILGNANFGDSIVFNDVNLTGNTFSGSVNSGSATGSVNGGLFGSPTWNGPSGHMIGGRATFSGRSELDSVFGGTVPDRSRWDATSTSTDLNPL